MRATNGIPLGCSPLLPVGTVICVETLKASRKAVLKMENILQRSLEEGVSSCQSGHGDAEEVRREVRSSRFLPWILLCQG